MSPGASHETRYARTPGQAHPQACSAIASSMTTPSCIPCVLKLWNNPSAPSSASSKTARFQELSKDNWKVTSAFEAGACCERLESRRTCPKGQAVHEAAERSHSSPREEINWQSRRAGQPAPRDAAGIFERSAGPLLPS